MTRELIRTYYVIRGSNNYEPGFYSPGGFTADRGIAWRFADWDDASREIQKAISCMDRAHVVEVKVYRKHLPTVEELVTYAHGQMRIGGSCDFYVSHSDVESVLDALRPYFPSKEGES